MAKPATVEQKQNLLLLIARSLHRYGTPSHRLERVMVNLSETLGIEASYLYTPTSLMVAFDGPGPERTKMIRVDAGDVDIGKLDEFDRAIDDFVLKKASLNKTTRRFQEIDEQKDRYPSIVSGAAWGVGSACATGFLGAGIAEVIVAFSLGILIFVSRRVTRLFSNAGNVLDGLVAFVVAMLTISIAAFIFPIDYRLATLGSLIVLVPGLTFTLAMTELATRQLVSGVARLAGAGVTFLTLGVGVALAWRLGKSFPLEEASLLTLPVWAYVCLFLISPAAFSILFSARRRQWPIVFVVTWAGFLSATLGSRFVGGEFGPFLGALAVGMLSNLYARVANRPAMVPQVPSILVLVPGSIGYQSLASFIDQDAVAGVELAFSMTIVAVSLVGGLLAANTVVPPRRVL